MQDADAFPAESLLGQVFSARFRLQRVTHSTPTVATFDGADQQKRIPVRIHVVTDPPLSPEQRRKIKDAAATMRQLGAIPGVVGLISGGVHNNHPFIVVPMLPGASLQQKYQFLPPDTRTETICKTINQWLPSVTAALDAAHKMRVCHGTLSPDSIAILANGSAVIDGLPLGHLLSTLEVRPILDESQTSWRQYQDPETQRGEFASPAADQYALAKIVAEGIGKTSESIKRATFPNRDQRFSDCSTFAAELIAEMAGGVLHDRVGGEQPPPLELAPLSPDEIAAHRIPKRSTADLGYELEIDDRVAAEATARQKVQAASEEDLSDLTFTRVKQGLLSGKSTYDKAMDLQATRASWRRVAEEYGSLSTNKRTVTKIVVATLVLVLAIWILQLGWQGVIYVTSAGRALAQRAGSAIPEIDTVKMQGQLAAKHMRELWDEHVTIATNQETPEGSIVAAPPPPQGEAWPSEEEHAIATDAMAEPTDLIDEIVGYKGEYIASQGIGVFHVDDPSSPELPTWIGGFGLTQGQRGRRAPLLHGTLFHQADGSKYVIRYLRGELQDFWLVRNAGQQIVYAKLKIVDGEPALNGAAVVLDTSADACLALDYSNGELRGGQWCTRDSNSDNAIKFIPPETILPIDALPGNTDLINAFIRTLDTSVSSTLGLESRAKAELQAYTRANRIR